MPLRAWRARSAAQPGAPGFRSIGVSREEWRSLAQDLAAAGGRLLAMWASVDALGAPTGRSVFLYEHSGMLVSMALPSTGTPYPGIEDLFPTAARMQRAMADLTGLRSNDPDTRPWLRHAAWPADFHPLIDEPLPPTSTEPP